MLSFAAGRVDNLCPVTAILFAEAKIEIEVIEVTALVHVGLPAKDRLHL